jgi:hypothetical protein
MSTIRSKNGINPNITVENRRFDSSTSLRFPGNNFLNWGKLFNENFYWLLENFAGSTSPDNPVIGQIWYDTTDKNLKIYDGTSWNSISEKVEISSSLPSVSDRKEGDLIFLITAEEKAFYIHDGTSWIVLIRIRKSNTPPSSPQDGDIWYNTVTNQLSMFINGTPILLNDTGGSGGTIINSDNHTTISGEDIYIVKLGGNIIAAFSYSNISAANLGIFDSINLSTIFPSGLRAGLNFSSLANQMTFNTNSNLKFENFSTGNIVFRIDNKDQLTIDKNNNTTIVDSKLVVNHESEFFKEVSFNSVSHIKLPVGTSAQRPTSPSNGMVRFNSGSNELEFYLQSQSSWKIIGVGSNGIPGRINEMEIDITSVPSNGIIASANITNNSYYKTFLENKTTGARFDFTGPYSYRTYTSFVATYNSVLDRTTYILKSIIININTIIQSGVYRLKYSSIEETYTYIDTGSTTFSASPTTGQPKIYLPSNMANTNMISENLTSFKVIIQFIT